MGLSRVVDLVRSSSSFLITSHVDLDGDAVGSELGLGLIMERIGKKVAILNQDRVPSCYGFLPGSHLLQRFSGEIGERDVALVLDCTCMERTGGVGAAVLNRKLPVVNIDHHSSNAGFGDVNVVRPDACAAAVLILELISQLGEGIGPDVATCLYTAVLAETGCFRLSNTTPQALAISARLAQEGADPAVIAAQVFGQKSPNALRLIGQVLRSLEVALGGAVSLMHLERFQLQDSKVTGDELEGVVNFAMSVEGAKVAAFLRELEDGVVKVSFRSNGSVDVDLIARQFGGGGHSNAAGATVPGTLRNVRGTILEKISEALDRR